MRILRLEGGVFSPDPPGTAQLRRASFSGKRSEPVSWARAGLARSRQDRPKHEADSTHLRIYPLWIQQSTLFLYSGMNHIFLKTSQLVGAGNQN